MMMYTVFDGGCGYNTASKNIYSVAVIEPPAGVS